MKSLCETCSRDEYGCAGCSRWRQQYLHRQKLINACARSIYQPKVIVPTKFCYSHPDAVRRFLRHSPCEDCQVKNSCNIPCAAYLQWWDARMEYIRRKYVKA